MTERHHPNVDQARALIGSERFCEWLDAVAALPSGWSHSRASASRWLERECGVDSLGRLGTDRQAADRLHGIARQFELWARNGELAL